MKIMRNNYEDSRSPLNSENCKLSLCLYNSKSGTYEYFEIVGEQGRGSSCIVYQAYICSGKERQRPVLLKEFYPLVLSSKIKRDLNTHALIFNLQDRETCSLAFQTYIRERDYFLRASERQRKAYLTHKESTDELIEIQGLYSLGDSYYVMMKASSGSSWDKINIHEESLYAILETGLSLLQELSLYHNDNTLHCDIKPANIYIFNKTRQHVILLDLGSAQQLNHEGTLTGRETLSYTDFYAAPEIIDTRGREEADRIDYFSCVTVKADLYSVAAVLYSRITGLKFQVKDKEIEHSLSELYKNEKNGWLKNISPVVINELSNFFDVMLSVDFDLRYDLSEMKKQLKRIMLHAKTSGLALHDRHKAIYPSEHFVGRVIELEDLRKFLRQGSKMIFIHGKAGIGKSELAWEIALTERNNYDFYRTVFTDNLRNTILTLQIEPPLSEYQEFTTATEFLYAYNLRCLKGYGTTAVLIIDDFDFPPEKEDEIFHSQEYSDLANLNMRIIFTSRHRPSHHASILEVQEMSLPELVSLIRSIYKCNYDDAILEKLIIAAKSNTFLVEQIARTLEQSWGELTPEKMLMMLDDSALSYNELVYKHIKILFNLSVLSEYSKEIMSRSILFPSSGINATIFLRCHDEIHQDKIRLLELNGWLKKTADNNIIVHSLIGEVCRRELSNIDENCAKFLESYYDEFSRLPFKEYILQRFQRVEIASNAAEILNDTAGVYAERAGDLNYQEGLYRTAWKFYNSYWKKFLQANSKPDPRNAMRIMDRISTIEYEADYYAEAIYHEFSGLCIAEKELGGEQADFVPEFFPYYLNFCNILREAGYYRDSIKILNVAENIHRKHFPEDYEIKIALYITKAKSLIYRGYIKQAKKYADEAIRILNEHAEISKPQLWRADILEILGHIYYRSRQYDNALDYYSKVILIHETIYGKEHPRTLKSYNNKAGLLIKAEKYDEVISLLFPILETLKSTLGIAGMKHSSVLRICYELALAYKHKGDTDQALKYCEQAININSKLLGFPVYSKIKALYENLTRKVDDI